MYAYLHGFARGGSFCPVEATVWERMKRWKQRGGGNCLKYSSILEDGV
jgi:hypothetical protein